MNFEYGPEPTPLRVLMINPLAPASQLIMMKILGGEIFGEEQLIDMTLLVYSNEVNDAMRLKIDLKACAYACFNSIEVSSTLPRITDADIFCVITAFPNPNSIDFKQAFTDEQFDTFYLLLKIAHNFARYPPPVEKPVKDDKLISIKKPKKIPPKRMRPIFVADGMVALDILYTISKHIPRDVFYCPTSIPSTAKAVLAEFLKVGCDVINDVLVWAANDEVFHVDVENPCVINDPVDLAGPRCDWKLMGKEMFEKLNLDHTQFNSMWLKKDYIAKVAEITSNNPYGNIFRGQMVIKTLQEIWLHRINHEQKKENSNMGIISDGGLDTIKGCPFVLPIHINGDTWKIDMRFENSSYLKHDIKRMNKNIKEHHQTLMSYCKKFLDQNVIKYAFVPAEESSVTFSMDESSTYSSSYTTSRTITSTSSS